MSIPDQRFKGSFTSWPMKVDSSPRRRHSHRLKMPSPHFCPLCHGPGQLLSNPVYASCPICGLAWKQPAFRLGREEERRHYQKHQNSPDDQQYRQFLAQLWAPLAARLAPGAQGLDFGSGPGPTLHLMACEAGFPCSCYDPFFDPVRERLCRQYDFITCSESAEHFHDPLREFTVLRDCLRPGGWLGIMTERRPALPDFADWYYLKDPTHVCFYAEETFSWLARALGFGPPVVAGPRVVLLRRT